MKKIKLTKEEDRDQKTLAKQYKRLEIFIIIFMAIAICLGTFYFNVICFGTECENKSPTPLIIINTGKTNTNDKENQNALQENDNNQNLDYIFGEEVKISKLENIDEINIDGNNDFSKWNILSTNGDLVTLYSSSSLGKESSFSETKIAFEKILSKYNVKVEEVRLLNENELELFGCDPINTKNCKDIPSWAGTSLTEVASEKIVLVFPGSDNVGKLDGIPNDGSALAPIRPVIVINKSELN